MGNSSKAAEKKRAAGFLRRAEETRNRLLNPSMAIVCYVSRVGLALYVTTLQHEASKCRPAGHIRSLVSEIILTHENGLLKVELRGVWPGVF